MVANIQLLLLMPIKLQLMLVMLLIWMGMVIWMALIILQLLRMILIISMDNAEWAHKAPDLARLWSSKEAADALCLGHLDSGYPNCCGRLMHDALDIWIGLAPARANCWSFSWRWSSKGRIDLTMLDADVTGVVANHRIHDFAAAMTSPSTISTRSDEGEDATNADLSLVTFRESFDLGVVSDEVLSKSLLKQSSHGGGFTHRFMVHPPFRASRALMWREVEEVIKGFLQVSMLCIRLFASPTVLDLMHLDLKRSASLPGAKLMRGVDFRPFQLLAEGVLRFPQGRLPSGGGPPLDDGNLYP
ncbi:unnamed protein product [Symbiodinium sp. KB8]|nr:unnamed protein product [Symbiodinium sp. KB8]